MFIVLSLDPPVLTSQPVSNPHRVMYGDDLHLNCSANGSLPISLKWYHNGNRLVSGGRVTVERHGELTVRNTSTANDDGIYQCYAENEAGFISADILVDVFSKLDGSYQPYDVFFVYFLSHSTIFHCRITRPGYI